MEISVVQLIIALALAAEVGWFAAWFVFDRQFYLPQRKLIKEQQKMIEDCLQGWSDAMDLSYKAAGITKVEADGSMKSPIQVIKEE